MALLMAAPAFASFSPSISFAVAGTAYDVVAADHRDHAPQRPAQGCRGHLPGGSVHDPQDPDPLITFATRYSAVSARRPRRSVRAVRWSSTREDASPPLPPAEEEQVGNRDRDCRRHVIQRKPGRRLGQDRAEALIGRPPGGRRPKRWGGSDPAPAPPGTRADSARSGRATPASQTKRFARRLRAVDRRQRLGPRIRRGRLSVRQIRV